MAYKRVTRGPAYCRGIGVTRRILILPNRSLRPSGSTTVRNIGVIVVTVHDLERSSVNLVIPPPSIEIRKRSDRLSDPCGSNRSLGRLDSRVVLVVQSEVVGVFMSKEDVGDDVRGETIDDLVEEVGGGCETLRCIFVTAGDVTDDPDFLTGCFGG